MKITMYELLGLVKDGKTPNKIIYDKYVYQWNNEKRNYEREIDIDITLNWDYIAINCLNEPVEILEKELRNINVCGSWLTKSEYDELFCCEEEKKIPEKLPEEIIWCTDVTKKINEIIDYLDYLKSKGDE